MANEEHFRKLEHMYLGAPTNVYYNPSLHITEGRAEVRIPADKKHFHAADAVHGAIYFKAADDSAFFAANSLVEECFVLTTNLNLHLERPIAEGEIVGRSEVVFQSRTLINVESKIFDGNDNVIGRATSSFFASSRIPLTEEIGYVLPESAD